MTSAAVSDETTTTALAARVVTMAYGWPEFPRMTDAMFRPRNFGSTIFLAISLRKKNMYKAIVSQEKNAEHFLARITTF